MFVVKQKYTELQCSDSLGEFSNTSCGVFGAERPLRPSLDIVLSPHRTQFRLARCLARSVSSLNVITMLNVITTLNVIKINPKCNNHPKCNKNQP